MIKFHNGDIFEAPIEYLLHSCNAFCCFGAGFALEIKKKFPRAYAADCLTERGSRAKLGQFSVALAGADQPFAILNLYSQFRYGRDKQYVDYEKFLECLENVKNFVLKMNGDSEKIPTIGIPFNISCANAGGSWDEIFARINYVFESEEKLKILICKK